MNPDILIQNFKQERLLTFFRDQKFVDCTFTINGQQVRAHKLILSCCSPVFEKMFYGEMASDQITLGDIQMKEFTQLLEFIYTDTIHFSSILNAWSMFYVAKKYILDDLVNECLDYISENLTLSTLVLSYEYSELYSLEKMKEQCLRDILDAVNAVFSIDYHMKPSTLRTILKQALIIAEIDLICKVIEWTGNECEQRAVCASAKNIVQILKEEGILKHVKRTWLFQICCEYCNDPLIKCQCVDDLVHDTLLLLGMEENWDEAPRLENCTKAIPAICKSRKVYKIARRIDLQSNEEFVSSMSVNSEMVICGISVCTEINCSFGSEEDYKGCITIRFCEQDSDNNIVKPTIMNNTFVYNSQVFIPLRYAVLVKPHKIYDIKISYKNFSSEKKSSIVCSYMSDRLVDSKTGYYNIHFYDFYGTIINGIAHYPA